MNFLKKNKITIVAIILFIGLVLAFQEIKNILVPDEGKAVYGDRLDGIENHPLSDSTMKGITSKLKENEKVEEATITLHGKIINIIITVLDDVSVEDAKAIANSSIPMFENKELSFYTLNVFVKKNNEALNNFPIEGYKGTETDELVFTKDRDITVTSEEPANEE